MAGDKIELLLIGPPKPTIVNGLASLTLHRLGEAKDRDALLKEGLEKTRDQYYYVPLHHQLRPWAMKKSVAISYSPDDRPQARFATVK